MLFCGGYQAQLRASLDRRCRELDINLLQVFGRALGEPTAGCPAYNAIFDVDADAVDGVVIVSTVLSPYCGAEGVARFAERYGSLPLCSIGVPLPDIPSVLVDNMQGMGAVMDHMIAHHGFQRIAFIGGPAQNPEANLRFEAYRAALERHGLSFDPAIVRYGDFLRPSGKSAIQDILARGARIDAVVAASDLMAFGAIEGLRALGHRVPRDIPVTGFDDLAIARLEDPPLSTVAQPFEALAREAIAVILDQIAGRPVARCTELPGELVIRRSCSCGGRGAARLRGGVDLDEEPERAEVVRALVEYVQSAGSAEPRASSPSIELDREELTSPPHGPLQDLLRRMSEDNERCRSLDQLRTFSRVELEELWHDACDVVTLASRREQAQQRLAIDEALRRLASLGEQLSGAFDLPGLSRALAKALPDAGIRHAFAARYVRGSQYRELEVFLALRDGEPRALSEPVVPARHLLPADAYDDRRTYLVFPLVFDTERLGVVAFEHTPDTHGQQLMRDHIAAALRNVALHEEVLRRTTLHERSVQERVAASQRLESLSVLAGGVAHDLNNVLGPLVALPDLILKELALLSGPEDVFATLRHDVDIIRSAAVRAAQTIKDLLTLSAQGKAAKEALELNRAVATCLNKDALRFLLTGEREIQIRLVLSTEPLWIRGSESHVARALTNLVRNAVEAIDAAGDIVVTTRRRVVAEAIAGYDTIPPGDYAVISVSDSGSGIRAQDLGRIFEPFFSKKRARDANGTGLGLAIVRGVVKEHEGFVDVHTTPGQGTTFELYFPIRENCATVPVAPPREPRQRARVLVVDDEPVQLRTARRLLTHLGYEVVTESSGRRAYELFRDAATLGESPFDLLILDVLLNESLDGLALLEEIHELFPEQRAVLVSGHAPTERVERAVAKGLPWLAKPYSMECLARAIRAALPDSERPGAPGEPLRPPRAGRRRTSSAPPLVG